MKAIVTELARHVGIQKACDVLAYPRSRYYRPPGTPTSGAADRQPPTSPRALSAAERETVQATLNSDRFVDSSPREVYGTLLDEAVFLCSVSTMYRILQTNDEVRERRDQKRHPAYTKPELLATAPNQVWTWDITKLRGPVTHTYYYLYTILDIFSRYVVGYLIAERELATLAHQLVAETCAKQGIEPDQLILHADRGSAMTSKTLALLLADLGVGKSHSRPYTSNDNPYSEAQFKTMKYRPDYPNRFGCLADARTWAYAFFDWYNTAHHHTGLGLMTPAIVHYGLAEETRVKRQGILLAAYAQHPERFVKGEPTPPPLPQAVWINPPTAGKESPSS
jgi:putative transposase